MNIENLHNAHESVEKKDYYNMALEDDNIFKMV